LTQRLLDRRGWALLISTPRGKGWFYGLYRRGQGLDPDFQSWNYPSATNPYLDETLIDAERTRLPERVFRQEYQAEFIEGSGQVFRNVRDCAVLESYREPVVGERYYGGLDLAKVEDFTVLVILNQGCEVVFLDRFHRLDWDLQVSRIKMAAAKYHRAPIYVDTTGAGEPVFEALSRAGVYAREYPFTAKSKAALVDNLSILFEKKRLKLPTVQLCPELVDELEAFEYSVTEQGHVRTGAPSGYHDDCVIGLALAAWDPGKREPPDPEHVNLEKMAEFQRFCDRVSRRATLSPSGQVIMGPPRLLWR
jgi:hypothetical protein